MESGALSLMLFVLHLVQYSCLYHRPSQVQSIRPWRESGGGNLAADPPTLY